MKVKEINEYTFQGKWITDADFENRAPRNVFHRQLEPFDLPKDEMQNEHVLFRKKFSLFVLPKIAKIYITADDYYKLYVNGVFVGQGPAPSYHTRYNYNEIDITEYLFVGQNTLAIHTYYQGLINRVWQSGDDRHGLLCDLLTDGKLTVKSDESFLTHKHTGYSVADVKGVLSYGTAGYDTQFLERYDSRAKEADFYLPTFDDSYWKHSKYARYEDHALSAQRTKMLEFERIRPTVIKKLGKFLFVDFGKTYVGYLSACAKGENGERIFVRAGQELNEDGSVRCAMRCNCNYTEEWILSGNTDVLSQFDYKSFRYVELEASADAEIFDIYLVARHYPFELKAKLSSDYRGDVYAEKIWELCVHSLKYGVQETIQDCMDREKGFYLGDGCYSALAHYVATGDDSMARKLIDDAFYGSFISDGLVTCMDCSFIQEIAEYPLILIDFLLWHYRLSGDREYLRENYKKAIRVMESYRKLYEKDGLLCDIDKWCVVEWPQNYRDGYAVELPQDKICSEPHVSINAYYLRAVRVMNEIAKNIGEKPYRNEKMLFERFVAAFYDNEKHLFYDGTQHRHISLIGNCFPYAYSIVPDEIFEKTFLSLLEKKGYDKMCLFTTFPVLCGLARRDEKNRIKDILLDEGMWKRMLIEGATTTFEGWGKDTKWNTSLFHLTMTYALVFLSDIDLKKIFQ